MNKILKFVYEMILFLSLFHLAREVHDIGKPFLILFKFSFLLSSSHTIFYHVLVTLFYYLFSFQHIDIPCKTNADCPKSLDDYLEMKCIDKKM